MEKNKKKWLLLLVAILILTNVFTFALATSGSLILGNRMLITVDDEETKNGIIKLLALKSQIEEEYYQDVDSKTLMEGAIKGMFESLDDPYSAYFTQEEYESYMASATGIYEGIGVVVSEDDNQNTFVIAPQKGTPADLAGIQSGDQIIRVDGEDVTTLGVDEVVSRVRGPADSQVTVTIARDGQEMDFTLTRSSIETTTVDSRVIDGVGYIQISEFASNTAEEFNSQLDNLLSQNITGLVIDLRSNPGGNVQVAVDIADRLLGETVVVYTEDKDGNRTDYKSDAAEALDLPMVVLVDGGSASSSEILAGALQDTQAATLVGTTTYGKGVVQIIKGLDGEGGFKVTNSEYFTPNGRNIQGVGLEPDVTIEATDYMVNNYFTDEEDVQLQQALEVISQK
ncbi:MAG: carboxyl-terminal processing protease [Eubacteriaceae bacterium]|jgi:carboxyl-terminal processing protease|nr:carboxyl-terminal processing protease [Eubacteriaceae bacterium]